MADLSKSNQPKVGVFDVFWLNKELKKMEYHISRELSNTKQIANTQRFLNTITISVALQAESSDKREMYIFFVFGEFADYFGALSQFFLV